ncbi:MAG TPA: hypothetical protein VGA69_07935 [Nitriliruptorales bacterium]
MTRWGVPGVTFAITLVFVVAVLPSALNVPQSNPTQTLEFAPIPPQDEDSPPPDAANLGSMSLGSSGSIPGNRVGDGNGLPPPPPPPRPDGAGLRPVTKLCVGNPPRQTDDPLTPPCVAFFEGDNGGATAKGVTGDEIRILIAHDGAIGRSGTAKTGAAGEVEEAPVDRCFDLVAQPYDPEEPSWVTTLRNWQHYFNERYQTYGRHARFIACFGSESASPESRRAEAAEHDETWDPFATIAAFQDWGYTHAYYDAIAGTGSMVFPRTPPGVEMFHRHQPLMWAYEAPLERGAVQYASAVCQMIAPFPVSFSGNADHGQPRTYGLLYTTDPAAQHLRDLKDQIVAHLDDCGVVAAEQATHPGHRYFLDSTVTPEYAYEAMARFQREGITTILWAGGTETSFSNAAGQLNYRPEWVLAADGTNDGYYTQRWQDKTVWDHAWVVTTQLRQGAVWRETPCADAYRSVEPEAGWASSGSVGGGSLEMAYACAYYEQLRQLFTAIQVAGPKLSPATVDRGFRAIPPGPSSSPKVPACFYEPNDWTCVKDATVMWWDSDGELEGEGGVGCWRPAQGGIRYLPSGWPDTDLADLQDVAGDPCNGEGRNLSTR